MQETPTLLIPNKICERVGICLSWKPCNDLGIFAYERKHSGSSDKPSQHHPTSEASIFHVRQDTILFRPVLRKVINESYGTFLDLQNAMRETTSDIQEELLHFSRQYRSIIRACLESLQDDLLKCENEIERKELQYYVTIFYSIECIWHLCEILFIDVTPGNVVLPHLQDWIRFHFPKYERNAAEMLCGNVANIESNLEYWPTIIGSLLQGRVEIARGLLRQHSSADTKVFMLVDQSLKAMPIYNVYSGLSPQEYRLQWNHWRVDIESKIATRAFSSEKNLEFIMKLVVKDELAWNEVKRQCETWYEMLPAWLFFTDPTVKSFELGNFAKHCIKQMSMENKLKHLDNVLLAAMDYDFLEVIKEIQKMSESNWFATHLTNLLYHSGQLSILERDIKNFSAKRLQESLILDYGTLLCGHKSLWQIGLNYLDHCSEQGLLAIQLLLPRLPLENELKTRKILREALKRKLTTVAQNICRAQAMKSMRRKRLSTALLWALKSQDASFISVLADKFLRSYVTSGKPEDTTLLLNLGRGMMISDRLILLMKYYEFHSLYEQGQFREAAKLLVSLLQSRILPPFFQTVVLWDTIPLLESELLLFSTDETYTIMNALERCEVDVSLKAKTDILRLAAARNLSRAILHEATKESSIVRF